MRQIVERPALEEGLADLGRGVRSFREQLDRRAQRRSVIGAVGPVLRLQPGQQAVPGAGRGKRRICRQDAQPAFGQSLERRRVPAQRREATKARLRQAANDDVGQRRGRLSLAGGDGPDAMDEVQVDVGVDAQGQEMIVIVGGRRGRDGDLRGHHARGEQRPHPAHRLDGLVIGRRRTDGA